MSKIGILYICTGPYIVFWDEFFKTFEDKFMLNTEKHYFIFTDNPDGIINKNDRVHVNYLQNQPWPLITLLRFQTFLSIKSELEGMDYLMFSNANIVCDDYVTEMEFLPRKEQGEELSFTVHPGYEMAKIYKAPYDRNKESLAYVPYNLGEHYIIGAMYAGTSAAFIKMSEVLCNRINEDLKRGVIAKWHDESHVNRYVIGRKVRYLSPSYCYPWRMEVTYAKKMSAVSKIDKFDVDSFKGVNNITKKSITKLILTKIVKNEKIKYFMDSLLFKSLPRL